LQVILRHRDAYSFKDLFWVHDGKMGAALHLTKLSECCVQNRSQPLRLVIGLGACDSLFICSDACANHLNEVAIVELGAALGAFEARRAEVIAQQTGIVPFR
jgi:hypothetical protein